MKNRTVIPIRPVAEGEEIVISLFEESKKIYPRAQKGWFNQWRWRLVLITQALFYLTVWCRWNDRQAVLFDLVNRKFYIFGLALWPQDFIYLAILLVVSALALFLFTAIAGRLFCGYACPQTVYTEIFMWIEARIEGDAWQRKKLDVAGLSFRKFFLKFAKHFCWLLFSFWTGFTFVAYFTPVQQLGTEILRNALGPWESFWLIFYALATYGNAGFLREQVCKSMCPYARFQSAMFDRDTLIVTYDQDRGEPRGSRSKKSDPTSLGLGSCVDCSICVQVCPTGIDIRQGLQYECIACGACIDACDQVMDKLAYPRGLIRYTTENALTLKLDSKAIRRRMVRPRVLIYLALLTVISLLSVFVLVTRVSVKLDVLRDRTMPKIDEYGNIENVYRLQIMNTQEKAHVFTVQVKGIVGAEIVNATQLEIRASSHASFPVRVRIPRGAAPAGSNRIRFVVEDETKEKNSVTERAVFLVPR